MSLILNGVNLDQEAAGKWWSFVNDWPHVHGWCAPAYRAELIQAVTGVTLPPSRRPWADGDVLAASGSLLPHEFTFAGTPTPALTGTHSGYNYRLADGSTLYAKKWAGMRWGTLADGENLSRARPGREAPQ